MEQRFAHGVGIVPYGTGGLLTACSPCSPCLGLGLSAVKSGIKLPTRGVDAWSSSSAPPPASAALVPPLRPLVPLCCPPPVLCSWLSLPFASCLTPCPCGVPGGLLGMPCTQHAVRSFECRPILKPYFWPLLTSFWFHTGFFFSFLCIWDVAHLICHPLLPNVNHFYPFCIPHIELSPLWGPREGRGDVAIHSPRTLRSLWYGLHPHHITDLARHQQASSPRSESPPPSPSPYSRSPSPKRPRTKHSPRSESRDTSSPPPRAKPRAPKHSKQADFTRLSGLFIGTVEYQVEGSFVVLMWALLLRCATSQVTGILG